jgi:SPP1 gp7 family putative phage head morphogenesis protein
MRALTKKWEQIFNVKSGPLSQKMADDANASSKYALHQSLKQLSGGLSLKTSIMTGTLNTVMKAIIAENVGLIKSIPSQYFTQIQGAVMRSISQGNGLQDLQPFFEKQKGMTKRRAKNIALDQTRKAYNGLNKGRMQALKIDQYEWLHSGGGQHPRPQHIAMSGNIYSLSNPPIIDDDTGERGIPGQLINCKCRMRPVVKFNEGKPE